uniref:Uncharacterized protein n=1 Tax=Pristionchus pacificus TaxID=54126 RepID=A0A2A6BX73_PRIPA|eukprot:PDM70514.1 hypothetical protein PRIPAC_46760 [Pristionchus pacificus]
MNSAQWDFGFEISVLYLVNPQLLIKIGESRSNLHIPNPSARSIPPQSVQQRPGFNNGLASK